MPVCFVVHSLTHLRAALNAGAASLRTVCVISAPAASAYAGVSWFPELVRQAQTEFPGVDFTAMLDCGDRGGDALAALKAGARHIVFTGHPEAARRLAAIAATTGARILDARPPACDLLNAKDPLRAASAWCRQPDEQEI